MRKGITLIIGLCVSALLLAQPKEVTLVVSGEGADKTEATNNALRSAIEQTFGAFVSANTDILNDDVVRAEIATISSGNVQSYEEINCSTSDGKTSVTLKAKISVGTLVNYARNHGSSAELDGATFGANLRLFEMNKKNSEIAIENLIRQLYELSKSVFDYELNIWEPALDDKLDGYVKVPMSIRFKANDNTRHYFELIASTLEAISIPPSEVEGMKAKGYKLQPYQIVLFSSDDYYFSKSIEAKFAPSYLYTPLDPNLLSAALSDILYHFQISDNLSANYSLYQSNRAGFQSQVYVGTQSSVSIQNGKTARATKYHIATPWNSGTESSFAYSTFTNFTPIAKDKDGTTVVLLNDFHLMSPGETLMVTKTFYVRIKSEEFNRITSIKIEPSSEPHVYYDPDSCFPKILRNGDDLQKAWGIDYFDGERFKGHWDW